MGNWKRCADQPEHDTCRLSVRKLIVLYLLSFSSINYSFYFLMVSCHHILKLSILVFTIKSPKSWNFPMKNHHSLMLLYISMLVICQNLGNVEGRYHFHKKLKGKTSNRVSPAYAPTPEDHISQPPDYPPPVPSDPSYAPAPSDMSDPGNSTSDCIFDVRSFGAVGDGDNDDTAAFLAAWKEACQVESGVVWVPSDGTFMITSTIFSGPCKSGLVFRVSWTENSRLTWNFVKSSLTSLSFECAKVDGVLMPPNGPDCWPKSDSSKQWLVFYRLDDMTLTGTGTIEGNGQKWWDLPCKPHKVKISILLGTDFRQPKNETNRLKIPTSGPWWIDIAGTMWKPCSKYK